MNIKLQVGDTAMVRIIDERAPIQTGKIIPVIHTGSHGLMVHTNYMGLHIKPEYCTPIDMPLQCLI